MQRRDDSTSHRVLWLAAWRCRYEHLLGESSELVQEVLRLESVVRINGEEDGKSEGNQRFADDVQGAATAAPQCVLCVMYV